MPEFDRQQLAQWTGGQWVGPEPGRALTGFCQDTRQLQPGQVFVALRTPRRDGHFFLEDARSAGAAAALVEAEIPDCPLPQLVVPNSLTAFQTIAREWRKSFTGKVIGITGSCGKTTSKEMLALLLGDAVHKTAANLNNTLGVPLTLTALDPTAHRVAVVEAGINELDEMAVLADMIQPDFAIITNIEAVHIQKIGSLEAIAREKSQLVTARTKAAIFPSCCLKYPEFAAFDSISHVLYPSNEQSSEQLHYYRIHYREAGFMEMVLNIPGYCEEAFHLPLVSRGVAANTALCLIAAYLCGVDFDTLRARLAHWAPADNRGQYISTGDTHFYVDCYNSSPAALVDAAEHFALISDNNLPRLYVIGGMKELGEKSPAFHRQAATRLPLRSEDTVVLIGEEAVDLLAGLLDRGVSRSRILTTNTMDEARAQLEAFSGSVFLKGSRAYALERLLPESLRKEAVTC